MLIAMEFNAVESLTTAFGMVTQAVSFIQDNAAMSIMLGFSFIPMAFKAFRSGKRSAK